MLFVVDVCYVLPGVGYGELVGEHIPIRPACVYVRIVTGVVCVYHMCAVTPPDLYCKQFLVLRMFWYIFRGVVLRRRSFVVRYGKVWYGIGWYGAYVHHRMVRAMCIRFIAINF